MQSAHRHGPSGAGYVIRFERGSRHAPHLVGNFLGWVAGNFIPCSAKEVATPYPARHIAKGVAIRAEQAYPGARFEVIPSGH